MDVQDEATRPPVQLIDKLLRPRSVAIVGASSTVGSFGWSVLRNLQQSSYFGSIYLINPKHAAVDGLPCLPSVDALPMDVDCAVLAIPRSGVMTTLEACVRRNLGAAIIFSAGFAEAGEAGRVEQAAILRLARESGMVVEGPNCLGMVNYVDRIPLTFVMTSADSGKTQGPDKGIAIVSQSGAMAVVLAVNLLHRGLRLSYSVSTGNEASSGVEDYVEYMIEDANTHVVTMIVEQFRAPQRFLQAARKARKAGKHIVLLHPGKSSAARASAATHTGAMAGDYEVMRVKVAQVGVLLVETLEELVDVADMLVRCPAFAAGGLAVLTESGAFKAFALDFCERIGLPLPALGDRTQQQLRAVLPGFIPVSNPLDITAQALVDPELYRRALPPLLADDGYGAILLAIILTDEATSGLKFPPILAALRALTPTKPVLFAAMDEGARVAPHFISELRSMGVPFFPSPERAFRALAILATFAETAEEEQPTPALQCPAKSLPIGVIAEYRSKQILAEAGIRVPSGALATSVEEAQTIAAQIGYPVVLKAQASSLTHKSEAGGVALNLKDAESVAAAWVTMHARISAEQPALTLDGLLVETMGAPGVELIVGVHNDSAWGPVLLIGFGGILAEVASDVRLLPIECTHEKIVQGLLQLKSAALLRGFRGSAPLDVRAVADLVARLSRLVLANPSIQEVDLNPVVVYPEGHGAVAFDALIVTH